MNTVEGIQQTGVSIVFYVEWNDIFLAMIFFSVLYRLYGFANVYGISKRFQIDGATIGLGNNNIVIKYDNKVQEVAYKIWVELVTRKIGLQFDEENDVIIEVYNSWYAAFKRIRELLEEIPIRNIGYSKGLSDIVIQVLNVGLRGHLTRWQAKFRKWYDLEKDKYPNLTPQEIQRKYLEYEELVSDLKISNNVVLSFVAELEKFIRQ